MPQTVLVSMELSTIGAPGALKAEGQSCYEVTFVATGSCLQVGWAAVDFQIDSRLQSSQQPLSPSKIPRELLCGVGACAHSWGADGCSQRKWHDGFEEWSVKWKDGDVIGVAADTSAGRLLFAHNGKWDETFPIEPGTGLYPVLSIKASKFKVNMGNAPFQYPPPDIFEPMPLVGHDLFLLRGCRLTNIDIQL
jgi:hypothetical protein|eukprot:1475580-Prymnesium_polylepis.1